MMKRRESKKKEKHFDEKREKQSFIFSSFSFSHSFMTLPVNFYFNCDAVRGSAR